MRRLEFPVYDGVSHTLIAAARPWRNFAGTEDVDWDAFTGGFAEILWKERQAYVDHVLRAGGGSVEAYLEE